MSNYSRVENFTAKDALADGDPEKIISGADVDSELNAALTAINSKADDDSVMHLTGVETAAGNKTFSGTITALSTMSVTGLLTALAGATLQGVLTMVSKAIWWAKGANIASATTTELWATDGNYVHITGTTTITSLGTAPQAGAMKHVTCDGAFTLTDNANIICPGNANIVCAADDEFDVVADSTSVARIVNYTKADGTVLVASGFGVSQTWQNVIGSRALSTSYQNTTGKPIMVNVRCYDASNNNHTFASEVSTDDATWVDLGMMIISNNVTGAYAYASFVVPNNHYYRVRNISASTPTISVWAELRV